MPIVDRIISVMEEKSLSGVQLGVALGLKKSPVTDWRNGKSKPTLEQIIIICERYAISADYLLFGTCTSSLPEDDASALASTYRKLDEEGQSIVRALLGYIGSHKRQAVPAEILPHRASQIAEEEVSALRNIMVHDLPASAGTGQFLDSDNFTLMDFPEKDVPLQTSFGVKICGISMLPRYNDGDIVFVRRQKSLEVNEIGIFLLNGDAYCKKYIEADGKPFLESMNPKYPLIQIRESDELRVMGKVIGSITP